MMTAKRVVCIAREPFVDKIPNLKAMLQYMGEEEWECDLVSPADSMYPVPSFLSNRIRHIEVRPREFRALGMSVRVPTVMELIRQGVRCVRRGGANAIIGAGGRGLVAAAVVSFRTGVPLISFCVELPADRAGGERLSWWQKAELKCIRRSSVVITHDQAHAEFIARQSHADLSRFAILPNGTRGEARRYDGQLLAKRLDVSREDVIVLHSGGMGKWFDCLELAKAARLWPARWRLVFHTSHSMQGNEYCDQVRSESGSARVSFSMDPVPTDQLDALVGSADIGIALYSLKELGYRAELMGLASGKIGNYLKCGVPVVSTDIGSIREYLEGYKCGVCVKSAEDVEPAISQVLDSYEEYSRNAIKCFEELWAPDRYSREIMDRIAASSC